MCGNPESFIGQNNFCQTSQMFSYIPMFSIITTYSVKSSGIARVHKCLLPYSCVFAHFFMCSHPSQVKMLVQNENGKLRAALVSNLKSAVIASFLMLPESFTEEDLFLQIAGLSYAGNHRRRLNMYTFVRCRHAETQIYQIRLYTQKIIFLSILSLPHSAHTHKYCL